MATVYEMCEALESAEAEQWFDCGALGISNIMRRRNGDGLDDLTFTLESGDALTSPLLFEHKTYVRLRRTVDGGTPELLFMGRVTTVPRDAAGAELEAHTYVVSGPGEQLARTVYRQDWVENSGILSKPRVILFQASNGSRMTTGAQIYDAVAWAHHCGVKISEPSGENILTGHAMPFDERVNVSCLDVITESLRYHPHAVVWWDYSQRAPIFHCRLRSDLSAVSAAMPPSGISISKRADLQVPAIAICYEKSVQVDDATWKNTTIDVAPVIDGETPSQQAARLNQPDVVWATFDLDGATQTNASQKIVTEPFPESYLDKEWWKDRETWLQDYDDSAITLANGGRANDCDLPRILVEGSVQPWMSKEVKTERIFVDATITKTEGGQVVLVETRPISFTVQATDAMTKTYRTVQAFDSGESIPEGVAASLFAEWSQLHHEGSLLIEEDECSGVYFPGRALNVTGGRAEWASMAAMISETVESFDEGSTSVRFGPVKTVDADSLTSLFRATRNRRFAYSRNFRDGAQSGEDPSTGDASLALNPSYSGLATTKRQVILDIAAEVKHLIDLDSSAFSFATGGDASTPRVIKPRERVVIYLDGGTAKGKLCQVLCSDGYGDEIPVGGRGADPSSPTVLGQDSEGSSDDAVTTSYDGASGTAGVSVWVCTRMRYDHSAGTPKLYVYMSKLTFPASIAPTVTGQTRVEIDTPEV